MEDNAVILVSLSFRALAMDIGTWLKVPKKKKKGNVNVAIKRKAAFSFIS